jgi:hypothetical protein
MGLDKQTNGRRESLFSFQGQACSGQLGIGG